MKRRGGKLLDGLAVMGYVPTTGTNGGINHLFKPEYRGGSRMFGLTDKEKAEMQGKINQKIAEILNDYGSWTGSGRRRRRKRRTRKPYSRTKLRR
jgi:hypothetical protein